MQPYKNVTKNVKFVCVADNELFPKLCDTG